MNFLRLAFEIGNPRDVAAELTMLASGGSVSHCGAWLPDGRLFTSLYESGPSFQYGIDLDDAAKWIIVPTRLAVSPADVARVERWIQGGWTYDLPAAVASGFGKRMVNVNKRFCSQLAKDFCQSLSGGADAFPGSISFNPWELLLQSQGKQEAFDMFMISDTSRRDAVNRRMAENMADGNLTADQAQEVSSALAG